MRPFGIVSCAIAIALMLWVLPAGITAGTDVPLSITIPEMIKLDVDLTPLFFDLEHPNPGEEYPPRRFPASYTPGRSSSAAGRFRVMCNHERLWHLSLQAGSPIISPAGDLSPDHIEWSLDGARWSPLSLEPAEILAGTRGSGWQEYRLYFRLRIDGEEGVAKGRYSSNLVYTLSSD